MAYGYVVFLLLSLVGLSIGDRLLGTSVLRSKSGVWALGLSVLFLLACDVVGIWLGLFATNPTYVSGVFIGGPDLPIEEVLLLTLIVYTSLVLHKRLRQ